jgi:hypothetical protein
MRKVVMIGLTAIGLLATSAFSPATAQSGFKMPSNNVFCVIEDFDGTQQSDLRCDIQTMTNRAPTPPADCQVDWGDAFAITHDGSHGERLCHGDTVRDDSLPVLPYGSEWNEGGYHCDSQTTGVTCENAQGHGFALAKAHQELF